MAESNESNVIDLMERLVKGEQVAAEMPEDMDTMTEWTFTNDKTNPAVRQIFHILYQGVFSNTVGVMHALNTETDMVETLIVGLARNDDGSVATWPLAKIIPESEQGNYKAPDGNGNWV